MVRHLYKLFVLFIIHLKIWPVKKFKVNTYKKILVIAPHPDDEILGIGGALLKMRSLGVEVYIIYLTDGENSGIWPDKEEIRLNRIRLSDKVCSKLGISPEKIFRFHLNDGGVPHQFHPDFYITVIKISDLINTINPDAVFTTSILDSWPFDHVASAELSLNAVSKSNHKPQLLHFWVWSWYNLRIHQLIKLSIKGITKLDIREIKAQKNELIRAYLEDLSPEGKPWCGVLPPILLIALRSNSEVIESITHRL